MTNPVAVIREITSGGKPAWRDVMVWCPGCESLHPFRIETYPDCPARNDGSAQPTWDWDGNLVTPTFSPSLLCHSSVHLCQHTYWVCPAELGGEFDARAHMVGYRLPNGSAIAPKVWEPVPKGAVKALVHDSPHDPPAWGSCHSFLRSGRWEFLSDSAHRLAGQTVDMVPLPDWFVRES